MQGKKIVWHHTVAPCIGVPFSVGTLKYSFPFQHVYLLDTLVSHILSSIALFFTSHLCKDPFLSFSKWHHFILAILLQVRQYLLAFQWPRYLEAVMSGWGHPVPIEILVSRKSCPPSNQHPFTIECSPLQGCEEEH